MTMMRKILYRFCVVMLALCAGVFTWANATILAVRSSEFKVPIQLEAGLIRTKDFKVHYSGRYDLALSLTKRENGKPTMDAERLLELSYGRNADVHFTLTRGETDICSASTLYRTAFAATDTHYYLIVRTVSLARGEKYHLRATVQTSIPELAPTQPSLSLHFSPSSNKGILMVWGLLRWLSLRVGTLFAIAVFGPLLWRVVQRKRPTQPEDGQPSSESAPSASPDEVSS